MPCLSMPATVGSLSNCADAISIHSLSGIDAFVPYSVNSMKPRRPVLAVTVPRTPFRAAG